MIGVRDQSPESDATVRLRFSLGRSFDDLGNPVKFDICAVALKAFLEVFGNLHAFIVYVVR